MRHGVVWAVEFTRLGLLACSYVLEESVHDATIITACYLAVRLVTGMIALFRAPTCDVAAVLRIIIGWPRE
jgi:hypothetical protein